MRTDLLIDLLGLVLFAIVLRGAIVPNLIRLCTLSSGTILYIGLHTLYLRWVAMGDVFGSIQGDSRLGIIIAAGILLVVLVRFAALPFTSAAASENSETAKASLPPAGFHVGVWVTGSMVCRVLVFRPSPFVDGSVHLTRTDLPLLFFCSMVLLVFVLWKLKKEYVVRGQAVHLPDREERFIEDTTREAKALQVKIDRLREDTAAAERRWATAVLQERAAKICAEKLAQQFAEARKMKEAPVEHPRPLSVREALAVFNLSPGCTVTMLKESYHRMIRMNHPDKVATLGPQLRAVAEHETKKINAAYSVLIDYLLAASPISGASQTPFHATVDYQRASTPNDFRQENREMLMGRPDVVTR